MKASVMKIKFPGAVVWVSLGTPTAMDKIGCDGVYVRKVLITNIWLFLLYDIYEKIKGWFHGK